MLQILLDIYGEDSALALFSLVIITVWHCGKSSLLCCTSLIGRHRTLLALQQLEDDVRICARRGFTEGVLLHSPDQGLY